MGGRGYRSRTQRKHFRESRENVWKRNKSDSEPQEQTQDANTNDDANPNPTWQPLVTENPNFEDYYKEQGIVAAEEWDTFMECLRTALPAAFRVNASSPFYLDIRSQLENDFMKSLQAEDDDGNEVEAIRPLPWYPDNLAWQSNFSRKQLRKNQTLERFHKFLKLENEIGNITRQEAVSMVPPLFLDVHPDHFVLDMCAAPGSKTFQLLEMIHQSMSPESLPSGMIVANDVDIQRCNLLIHQTKRMCTANLVVTTHEAQHFPGCHLNKNCLNAFDVGNVKNEMSQLLFDRILCDVPCSGDGTLRKAPDIWRKWNAGMGNGLHGLQILIAMRGLSLLKVGGRMVYSTCSMNPVENEAVVAEILRRCQGTVELVDVSTELPQLIRRPGLKKWKVRDKGEWLASYKDVSQHRRAAVVPGMFPSGRVYDDLPDSDHGKTTGQVSGNTSNGKSENGTPSEEDHVVQTNVSEEEVSALPLERCMRIVPHDQNTGAFFIAVLHKLLPLPVVQKKIMSSAGQLSSSKNSQTENATVEVKDVDMIAVNAGVGQGSEATSEVGMQVPETTFNSIPNGDETVEADSQTEKATVEVKDIDMIAANVDVVRDSQVSEATPGVGMEVPETTSDAISDDDKTVEAALDTDPSKVSEGNELTEIQPSEDKRTSSDNVGGKRKLQIQGKWVGVDPVIFYKDEAIISTIKEFYGIKESIPFSGHLVTRNSDTSHVKRIYYVSCPVKEVLELNHRAGQPLKIASVGLKMFERQTSKEGTSSPCAFRISSEGLPLLLPHMTKQILYASIVDFKHLLQYKSIKFKDFTDAEFGKKASELTLGCCVVVLKKDNQTALEHYQVGASTIAIGCWRGKNSVSVMVTAIDCQELLERLLKDSETEKLSSQETNSSSGEAIEVLKTNDAESKGDTEATTIPALG